MMPLGISSIIAVLEQYNYRVKFVDFNIYNGNFKKDLKIWCPKIIGIGGTTPTRKNSFKIARLCKEVLPESKIVYGGPHASFTAEDTLQNIPQIDYIVKGEGEFTFLGICDYFIRNKNVDIANLSGLCYRNNGSIKSNQQSRIESLDVLPIPKRNFEYNIKLDFIDLEADYIITSRGCPVKCTFCSASAMFPHGVRHRSMEHIKKEIDYILGNKPVKALKVFDSTFTSSKEHVENFCKLIKPYNLLWECEIRADSVNRDLLKLMKEAGCYYVDIGLETTAENLLVKIGKRITLQQIEDVLQWCKELGIKTKLFLIFGLLDQTMEECKNDLTFLKSHKDKINQFGTTIGLRVYPGTALERQLLRRKILPQGFSWANFKPSLANLILLETSDTVILNQNQLTFLYLLYLMFLLILQGTILSKEGIKNLLIHNIIRLPAKYLKNISGLVISHLH